jgi:hypothetical protein
MSSNPLGTAGAGHPLELNGRTYLFTPMTKGMEDAFSKLITEEARKEAMEEDLYINREVRKMRRKLSEDLEMDVDERRELSQDIFTLIESAKRQMPDFRDKKSAGWYHYYGPICQDALSKPWGIKHMALLMLKPRHPEMDFEEISELVEKYSNEITTAIREVQELDDPLHRGRTSSEGQTRNGETVPNSTKTESQS